MKLRNIPQYPGRLARLYGGKAMQAAMRTPRLIHELTRNPHYLRPWIRDRLPGADPIGRGLPWISYPAIGRLEGLLEPGMKVFEWGGGGSTIFLARSGCRVTCVESSEFWCDRIRERLDQLHPHQRETVDLRFQPADPIERPEGLDAYVDEVSRGGPWDLILVDGWERARCARAGAGALRPGGLLLFDNADHRQFSHVPEILSDFEREQFPGLGALRVWATQTDIYRCPNHAS